MAETTSVSTQPATFIEAESKLYLDQLKNAIGGLKGADLSKIMGPQFVAGIRSFNTTSNWHGWWSWFLCNLIYKQLELLLVLHAYQSLYVSISTRCYWNDIIKNMIFKHKKEHKVFQLLQ
jgi:hypothetical protein